MMMSDKPCSCCGVRGMAYSPDKRSNDGLQSRCADCCKAAKHARYYADVDAAQAKRRAEYVKNRERVLASNSASREKNRESILQGKRDYYQRVKDTPAYIAKIANYQRSTAVVKKQYDRQYRARHSHESAERARLWRINNPAKRAAVIRTYTAKRRAVEAIGVSGGMLAAWTQEQPKACFYCGADCREAFHVDHFMPLAKGGMHVLTNLRIACPTCNLRKNAKMPDEWIEEIDRHRSNPLIACAGLPTQQEAA